IALSVSRLARRLAPRDRAVTIIELASNAALLIGGAALLGYAYRISDLYRLYLFNTMSLQSALTVVCLAVAQLIAEPETRLGMALRSPSIGAIQLRRMALLTILPVVLGWLLLHLKTPFAAGNGAAMALLVMVTDVPI